jgi:xanthine dehydrogenase iron-sulfur cluster and FAD-binding subunit A
VAGIMEMCVNGSVCRVNAEADKSLLLVLRDDLALTGAKIGCGEGECGTCTVVVDNEVCRACITPVGAVTGKRIRTVEGLGSTVSCIPPAGVPRLRRAAVRLLHVGDAYGRMCPSTAKSRADGA